jgi:CubicO group peptidase (beta-lactamase class C family)
MKKSFQLVCLLLFITPAEAQSDKAAEIKIDSIFGSYNTQTPGVAVAIVRNGKVVLKKGYGMANLTYNIPVTPQTIFDIASVSKQFTAFAIYLLENEGKISLEDTAKKYIPELPDYAKTIKIKHLLAHTSGLMDHGALASIAGYYITDITTTSQILKMMYKQRGLVFPPGTAYKYCNSSYVLLTEIIQRTTGKTFAAYTTEKIFSPLGMNSTLFCDNYQLIVKNKADSYEKIRDTYYYRPSLSTTPGPSGLLTTVEDLTKWALNFEKPIVGNKKLIDRFNEVSYFDNGHKVFVRMDEGDSIFYAKGQFVTNYRGVKRIGHGGHTAGFRTFFGRFPEQRLSTIHLSNDEHNEDLGGRYDMAAYYIKGFFIPKKPMASPTTTPTPSTTPKPVQKFSVQLTEFAGTYLSDELDTRYYVEVINNQLVMKHIRLDDIVLQRKGENSFTGSGPNTFFFEINFTRNGSDSVSGFNISNWGAANLKFVKQKPFKP